MQQGVSKSILSLVSPTEAAPSEERAHVRVLVRVCPYHHQIPQPAGQGSTWSTVSLYLSINIKLLKVLWKLNHQVVMASV